MIRRASYRLVQNRVVPSPITGIQVNSRFYSSSQFLGQPKILQGGRIQWENKKGSRSFELSLLETNVTAASTPSIFTHRSVCSLNNILGDDMDVAEKVKAVFANSPEPDADFDEIVQLNFPGALSNKDLVSRVVDTLALKGYSGSNTLLGTSFCCDELARQLEDDFNGIYGHNFNLGGLSGFPFAGNTGFGAMAAHIPDNGYCFVAYGPHVGITADGHVGKVERSGIELVDSCCGSAIAASNYVKGITEGGAQITTKLQEFTDFQQGAVQELILPHGRRLADAEDRMAELPFALYESQDMLMREIVKRGATGIKRGLALLGGVQINTGPDTLDYFVPLRFDFMNSRGEVIEDMLPSLKEYVQEKLS
jgi:hypothetical protein